MTATLTEANEALESFGKWADVKPSEPIGYGLERRSGNWVIVVSIHDKKHEFREWPSDWDHVPVLVEHSRGPSIRMGYRVRRGGAALG